MFSTLFCWSCLTLKIHQLPEIYLSPESWALSQARGDFGWKVSMEKVSKMKGYDEIWWVHIYTYIYINIWMFPKIGVPQNGWFTMENPIKMDDLGVPLFSETSIWVWCGSLFNNVSWHMRCFFGASLLLSWSPLKINGWKMDILLLSLFTGHSFVFRGVCCWCIHVLCSENDDIVTASNQTSSPWLLHCCISYW